MHYQRVQTCRPMAAPQADEGARDQACRPHPFGFGESGVQRLVHIAVGKRADRNHDRQVAEVAIVLQQSRRATLNCRAVHIHRIGDQRCRHVRASAVAGERGDRVGDTEGKAAAALPAGGDTAHRHGGLDGRRSGDTRAIDLGDDANLEPLAGRKVKRDIAPVVDVGAFERTAGQHRRQHFVGDGAGDRRHRRYVYAGMRSTSPDHAAGDWSCDVHRRARDRHAQLRKLRYQLVEDWPETGDCLQSRRREPH